MSEKTIKMPRELGEKWLAALRGDEYKQAAGFLCDPGGYGYCCLGVLQMVADGHVETEINLHTGNQQSKGVPTIEWLDNHGISFSRTLETSGDAVNPALPTLGTSAAAANDDGRYNFKQIADAIEEAMEYTD
jgi:hypothetical protein